MLPFGYSYSKDRLPFRGCKCKQTIQSGFIMISREIHFPLFPDISMYTPDKGSNLCSGFPQVPGVQPAQTQNPQKVKAVLVLFAPFLNLALTDSPHSNIYIWIFQNKHSPPFSLAIPLCPLCECRRLIALRDKFTCRSH